mmetsp:Transcript_28295/g.68897  ORF Transcript_28295/g.68897 Transcript_28295/m.68897 type:complete len:365 (+) Transcript_28295:903-1997(+)
MHTCRCSCMYSRHSPSEWPIFEASEQRRSQLAAESDPRDSERTSGVSSSFLPDSSVRKSSIASPNPSPSSALELVFVLETQVVTFSPKHEIMCTSRVPSPQLSPPGDPWDTECGSKATLPSVSTPGQFCCANERRLEGEYPNVPGPQTIWRTSPVVANRSSGIPYAFFWLPTEYELGKPSLASPARAAGFRPPRGDPEPSLTITKSKISPMALFSSPSLSAGIPARRVAVIRSPRAETLIVLSSAPIESRYRLARPTWASSGLTISAIWSRLRCWRYLGFPGVETAQNASSRSTRFWSGRPTTTSASAAACETGRRRRWRRKGERRAVRLGMVVGGGGAAEAADVSLSPGVESAVSTINAVSEV